jgi:endonuclease/exonuclease/phosphatase family metal-dependent hydrolase
LSVLNERYLKVDYSNTSSINIYQKLKALRGKIDRSSVLQWFQPFAGRVISVTEPLGRISIVDNPVENRIRISDEQISILTANLWHDWPRHRRFRERLECFLELVIEEDVDVLLLQETARTKDFRTDEWLSDQLGMAYVYSRANGHVGEIGFEEGLAVLSRFPINSPRLAQLSDHKYPFIRRIALGAEINFHERNLLAFTVHLSINGRHNQGQFHRLINWVDKQSGSAPAVIGGDFNARENTSQIRKAQNSWRDSFREFNPGQDGYTHEIQWPWGGILSRSRFDYLFLKKGIAPWEIDEARQIQSINCEVSDHTPVLIKARIPAYNQINSVN